MPQTAHIVRSGRLVAVTAVLVLLAGVSGPSASSASGASMSQAGPPRPSPFPVRWELDFAAGPLRLFVHPADGSSWWYFTYRVTNRTGRDQVWAPELVLFTDAGEILDAGNGVPTRVTESIRGLLRDELLETQSEIIGSTGRDCKTLSQRRAAKKKGVQVPCARCLSRASCQAAFNRSDL